MSNSSHSLLYTVICLYLFCLHLLGTFVCSSENSTSTCAPLENIALTCGSFEWQSPSYDGRNWTGDVGSQFVKYNTGSNSTVSTASSMDPLVPQVPYESARIFHSKFTYTFKVSPGPKFVRLHFYPNNAYSGLDGSKAFLSVTSGNYTLLRNFSAFAMAGYLNVAYFFKEFIVHAENRTLSLTFSPSSNASDSYAFVNGIEIVSMPSNLYIDENRAIPFVGHPNLVLFLDNTSALETNYRVDVGGESIYPNRDNGLFRTWTSDAAYIFGAEVGDDPFDFNTSITYNPSLPSCIAPEILYRTSVSMTPYYQINLNYNLTWFFPVNTGFLFLVRLHFCEVYRQITEVNQRVFDIFINNQTAQIGADIIAWTGGYGIPTFEDYIVMVPATTEGIQDLWLDLHPNTRRKSQYYDALLNGVEIFKVSNSDGNLAGLNFHQQESPAKPASKLPRNGTKRKIHIIAGCLVSGGIVAFLIFSLVTFWLKKKKGRGRKQQAKESGLCRHFSIREIKRATKNFDAARVIGSGGFGVVYKGSIDGGATTIAVKRRNKASTEQGIREFDTEILTLSHLAHHNIVSLIGYCNDDQEMILVYEYVPNGSLFEHLHVFEDQLEKAPLSWAQRLQICIGAARGLHYLHTGAKAPIIHRDVKTTNILIDNNLEAKVSDFGLSKECPSTMSTAAPTSTNVKGSIGYLDPQYYRHHILTEKSDVYSFGVVLLEVLAARPVVNIIIPMGEDHIGGGDHFDREHESLVEWGLSCLQKGCADQIIDAHLRGTIKAESLAKYLEVICKCLEEQGASRPSMSEVLHSLEIALQLHLSDEHGQSSRGNEITVVSFGNSDKMLGVEFSELMIPSGR